MKSLQAWRDLRTCKKYCKKAKHILQERLDPSPIASWAREIMAYGRTHMQDENSIAESYTVLMDIADNLYDHPRLMREIKQLAYDMVVRGEELTGETYPIKDDIRKEIEYLDANIAAADEGRWEQIQTKSFLKSDPIEWTKEYEAIIDEAEEEAYSQLTDCHRGMGFCFAYWAEKRNALARRGIDWMSPQEMNPGTLFD